MMSKPIFIVLLVILNLTAIVHAQESSLETAISKLLDFSDYNNEAKNKRNEEFRFLSRKLLTLDKYERIDVQEGILRLIIQIEERDKDKDYWEGHPGGMWLRLVYASTLCGKEDLLLSTVKFQEIEWIKHIREDSSDILSNTGFGKTRIDFIEHIRKNNLTRKFTGNLLGCAK